MRKMLVVLAIATLAATGCAQDDDPTLEGAPTDAPAEEAPDGGESPDGAESPDAPKGETKTFTSETFDLEMELDDYYFEPTTVKAPGGSTATIELSNEGDASHTFTIDALEVDENLEPGASKQIEVNLGTETRYEYYCKFHQDSEDMRGAFSLH